MLYFLIKYREKKVFSAYEMGSTSLDIVSFTSLPFTAYTPIFSRDHRISNITHFLSKAKQLGSVCYSNSIHLQGKTSLAELLSGCK